MLRSALAAAVLLAFAAVVPALADTVPSNHIGTMQSTLTAASTAGVIGYLVQGGAASRGGVENLDTERLVALTSGYSSAHVATTR